MEVLFNVLECLGEIQSICLMENQCNLVGSKLFLDNTDVNPSEVVHTTYTPPIKSWTGVTCQLLILECVSQAHD